MARVNIEDHAFGDPNVVKLAMALVRLNLDNLALAQGAALGILAYLWHESQSERVVDATVEQIEQWTGVDGIVPALVATRFLVKQENGLYRIRGNTDQIAGLEKKAIAGRKGAQTRWQTIAPAIECQASDSTCLASDGTPMAKNGQLQLQLQDQDPIQKIQPKMKIRSSPAAGAPDAPAPVPKEPRKSRKKDPGECTVGTRIWLAYADEMAKCWNCTTLTAGYDDRIECAKLARQMPEEEAIAVVRHFAARCDPKHLAEGPGLRRLNERQYYRKMQVEIATGIKFTKETIRDIADREESAEYSKRVELGLVRADPFALTEAEIKEESRRLEPAR